MATRGLVGSCLLSLFATGIAAAQVVIVPPPIPVFVPELSPILAESWPLVSSAITISLFDSGVSFTGVGEEWMRPSESAIAIASVSFDWVVIAFAFFLFDLTPPSCNKRASAKVPKEGCKEKGPVRTRASQSRRLAGEDVNAPTSPLNKLVRFRLRLEPGRSALCTTTRPRQGSFSCRLGSLAGTASRSDSRCAPCRLAW